MNEKGDQVKARDDDSPERYKEIAGHLIKVGLGSVAISISAYFLFFAARFFVWGDVEVGHADSWGQFGDFVGGIAGTVLTVLTLWAVARTLRLQAKELNDTKELLKNQAQTQTKQAFESTFFQLLRLFIDMSAHLTRDNQFAAFQDRVAKESNKGVPQPEMSDMVKGYARAYANPKSSSVFGPYFRTLYHTAKFVDESQLLDEEKDAYMSLARAQLGSDELTVLILNLGLGEEGRDGMLPYAKDYGLLKHARTIPLPAWINSVRRSLDEEVFLSRKEREELRRETAAPGDTQSATA